MPGVTFRYQCKGSLNAIERFAKRLSWLMSNPEKVQLDNTINDSLCTILEKVKIIRDKIDNKEVVWRK